MLIRVTDLAFCRVRVFFVVVVLITINPSLMLCL